MAVQRVQVGSPSCHDIGPLMAIEIYTFGVQHVGKPQYVNPTTNKSHWLNEANGPKKNRVYFELDGYSPHSVVKLRLVFSI